MSNGSPAAGAGDGRGTTQDIIDILNSEVAKELVPRLTRALDQKKDSSKREALKDEIFGQAMTLLDLLVDTWTDIKAEKAVEGGYETEVDEIDVLIGELRDKVREAYNATTGANSEEAFKAVKAKIEEIARLLGELKKKIKLLERKQRRAKQKGNTPPGQGSGGTAPGGTAPGGTAPGGTAPGGTAPGGTAPGGTAPGGTAPGGTAPGGTAPGGTTTPGEVAPPAGGAKQLKQR